MYVFLDYFFLYFHLIFTLFNLFGWLFKKTRRIHLVTIGLTFVSWFGFGLWYGIGYCPLTDWHWAVREKLGETDMPRSYITFIIEYFTRVHIPSDVAGTGTIIVFLIVLALTLALNIRDSLKKKRGL